MTCNDCIHSGVCAIQLEPHYILDRAQKLMRESNNVEHECLSFKDRSRFVELPCKVGDTAWIIVRCKNGKDYFYTGIVTGVHVTDRKTIYKLPSKRFNYIIIRFVQTDSLKRINFNEIGKTIFFTKEEAEKALKEREKDE